LEKQLTEAHTSIEHDEVELDNIREQIKVAIENFEKLQGSIDGEREKMLSLLAECENKKDAYTQLKRAFQGSLKKVEALEREVDAKRSLIEKVQLERWEIIRKCKLESIELPLLRGSLEQLKIDEVEVKSMHTQQQLIVYLVRNLCKRRYRCRLL
jgi:structural maintenance of chromosome 1